MANGLADEAGGLTEALEVARQRGGLPSSAPVRVFPRTSPLEQIRPAESSEARPAAAWFDGWGSLGQLAARAGLPPHGPLMLPGIWTIS